MTNKKRAIALAGGGPAAGLHIGALHALENAGIEFDVFALSCIGAWVGIVYNTRTKPNRAMKTRDFFEQYCFRDDKSYEWFPINLGFATDVQDLSKAWMDFTTSPERDWASLVLPNEIQASIQRSMSLFAKAGTMTPQDFNYWVLNDVLAVNPVTRFLTSLVYRSEVNGLSKVYYKGSAVLNNVFEKPLDSAGMPEIYHNAWRLPKGTEAGEMQIFHNLRKGSSDGEKYKTITRESLCACSALPFIEESVVIDGYEYTEGALVDTVNFKNILRDRPDLDEVWVNRIVDQSQVKSPRGLAGALGNLPMQFAAEVGENDIKLFRQHLLNQTRMRPRLVEIPIVPKTKVTFEWKHSNLMQGFEEGAMAVEKLLEFDPQLRSHTVV